MFMFISIKKRFEYSISNVVFISLLLCFYLMMFVLKFFDVFDTLKLLFKFVFLYIILF